MGGGHGGRRRTWGEEEVIWEEESDQGNEGNTIHRKTHTQTQTHTVTHTQIATYRLNRLWGRCGEINHILLSSLKIVSIDDW